MDVQWRVWGVINNTQAPSPNLLKLPAHTVGPLPAARCEHNRSNTPENQSAHPLDDAHTSLLWWSDNPEVPVRVEEKGSVFNISCESEKRNVGKLENEKETLNGRDGEKSK